MVEAIKNLRDLLNKSNLESLNPQEVLDKLNPELKKTIKRLDSLNYHRKRFSETRKKPEKMVRLEMCNERWSNPDSFFSGPISKYAEESWTTDSILGYAKEHLIMSDDPIIKTFADLGINDYALFSFGAKIPDETFLQRLLARNVGPEEYLIYLGGFKPLVIKDEKSYFVKKPENFIEIVQEYVRSHPSLEKDLKKFY